MPLAPGTHLGPFEILAPLGSGGMGEVYRCRDTRLERTVAIKVLTKDVSNDPLRKQRFEREAKTISVLNHPNICTLHDIGSQDGVDYLVMECLEGETLAKRLEKGALPLDQVLKCGAQIADALDKAHRAGIVHRDLKPGNIMLTASGAKLLDFGLAKPAAAASLATMTATNVDSPATEKGTIVGTFQYMSPEQIEGNEVDGRSDIFSLGAVLYEMAAGARPFRGDNLYRLCTAIIQEPMPALPPQVPAGLTAVIRKCLEKEPSQRYQRASEPRSALEALETSSGHASWQRESDKPRRRTMLWSGLATAAVLIVGVAIGMAWRSGRHTGSARAAGIPERVQIAVLLASGGADAAESAFNDGLVETLTSRLTQLTEKHPLAVIPASEVRARKVTSVDAARAVFGVNLGLVLNVQHAAGQDRVNYSFVDASSHQQLRAGTITVPASDPFALQDQVSESVAQALELQLQPQEKQALQAHGTTQPAAYDFYLQGRGYLQDYVKPENVENAINVFTQALAKDPGFAAANAGLGEAYWRKYQVTQSKKWADAAAEQCRKSSAQDDTLAAPHICLGRVLAGTGSYEKAVAEYRRAVELEPTDDAAYGGLGYAYEQLNEPGDAEKTFKQAIAARPNYWATYNWLGTFYKRHGHFEDAVSMFSQVISLAPDSFTGYYNLGAVRILQGKYEEAIPVLQRSLEIRKTANATSNLATAYFQLHRFAESATAFEQATQLDPQDYLMWGNLGDAYHWAPGRRSEAAGAYGRAITLGNEKLRVNPRDAEVLSSLAMYYAMRGERKQALDDLNAALRLQPKNPQLLFNAAIAYQQLSETEKALDALEKSVSAGASRASIRDTPNFEGLRANPKYQKLVGQ